MDDLLQEFLTETGESLDIVDMELVRFERDPNNAKILDNIFRLVHTIKGTCGFLGLPRLEALAHAAETLMGRFRDGAPVTTEAVSVILASLDQIKVILGELEQTGVEPEGDDGGLIDKLVALAEDGEEAQSDQFDEPPAGEPVEEIEEDAATIKARAVRAELDALEKAFNDAPGPETGGDPAPSQEPVKTTQPPTTQGPEPEAKAPTDSEKTKATEGAAKPRAPGGPSLANQTIRVNLATVENLMTMVSELVLTRNQLLEISRQQVESAFTTPLQRLSNVTADLQEGVMKTRMQPIGSAWSKLPRIVRDLGQELGKPIDLVTKGAETELDRQVLELIKDPLTHMVRNSADHGIEGPEERKKAGKSETGTIRLSAYHEGGQIIIEISDDGRGINTEKLKAKAQKQGLVSDAELAEMSENQIHKLVFHPGFSTAEVVTAVSGRGVGMDVVRTNIEVIGGSVDMRSVAGEGTTFTIKIPLTLAIIPALIVAVKGQRFAIPQLAVTQLVRANRAGTNAIECINGASLMRLNSRLLPLIALGRLLELEEPGGEPDGFVVVAEAGTQSFGIVVDEVFHTEEIVVKPMTSMLKGLPLFSGNTILGDGSVIMILDPNGLAQSVGQAEDEADGPGARNEDDVARIISNKTSLLVFEAGPGGPKAVPLSVVTRLEEFDTDAVEHAGEQHLVQYRGELMPLIYANRETEQKTGGRLPMLVFADGGKAMGLVVDRIEDIVEETMNITVRSQRPGYIGSAIIKGQATEILDLGHFMPEAHADWFERAGQRPVLSRRILYAEDSAFFRNMAAPVLRGAGFDVVMAADGQEAFEILQSDTGFDLVLTDIEMPNMDGFTLAKNIQDTPELANIPVVALSAFTGPHSEQRALEVGMVRFVAKFDRDELLSAIEGTLAATDMETAA
ncbi:MAG: hybrid sensor histidine kinase/response regulator [Alphaproteobacteria bacterium]|nr:hybrid sensor histidine kinase/response regulator [Alphaproteobacteria bacterium]